MRTLSGLMEPTGGGRGHDLFLIFGRVDNVNTPRRAQLKLGAPLHNPYGQNESCCRTAPVPIIGKEGASRDEFSYYIKEKEPVGAAAFAAAVDRRPCLSRRRQRSCTDKAPASQRLKHP